MKTDFTFENMLAMAAAKPELTAKEEVVDGVTVTIFSYMVQMKDTFDSPLALEFRGSVFRNDTGECICRPFKKFFNVGEREETLPEKFDFEFARFYTKHDGSLLTPVLLNDKIFWKTKKSFYSDVAVKASRHFDSLGFSEAQLQILKKAMETHTLIYEYVGPDNRIVLDYSEEKLIPLGSCEIGTGIFSPSPLHIQSVKFDDIYEMEGIEGFVIHIDGLIVKMKTKWYLDRHKVCTEFLPKRMIQATLDDSVDDVIATVYQLGMPERAAQIEKLRDEVNSFKLGMIQGIETAWDSVKHITDRREFALVVLKKFPTLSSMLFKKFEQKGFDSILDKLVFEEMRKKYRFLEEAEGTED